jgi:hypothetical protein
MFHVSFFDRTVPHISAAPSKNIHSTANTSPKHVRMYIFMVKSHFIGRVSEDWLPD